MRILGQIAAHVSYKLASTTAKFYPENPVSYIAREIKG